MGDIGGKWCCSSAGGFLLFLYLDVGGADCIGTLQDVAVSSDPNAAAVLAAFHIARHVLLYATWFNGCST